MTTCSRWAGMLAVLAVVSTGAGRPAEAADHVVYGCLVKHDNRYDVNLPAREAGVLVELSAKEGSQVASGEVLGKVDDSESQQQKRASEFALSAARKRATDTVQIEYAEKSAEVAKAGYEKMRQANQRSLGTVPEIDELKAKLEWDAAILSARKAKHDQDLAKFEYHVKSVERDAAQLAIDRRAIRAPFAGEVVEVYRDQDEWVSPGDAILRLVRLDTMLVEGLVQQDAFDPHEVQNCDVTVEVEMARGRKERVGGRIHYVSSLGRLDGTYLVRAEVANRKEFGRWLLRHDVTATMTIHLDTGGAAPLNVSRAP